MTAHQLHQAISAVQTLDLGPYPVPSEVFQEIIQRSRKSLHFMNMVQGKLTPDVRRQFVQAWQSSDVVVSRICLEFKNAVKDAKFDRQQFLWSVDSGFVFWLFVTRVAPSLDVLEAAAALDLALKYAAVTCEDLCSVATPACVRLVAQSPHAWSQFDTWVTQPKMAWLFPDVFTLGHPSLVVEWGPKIQGSLSRSRTSLALCLTDALDTGRPAFSGGFAKHDKDGDGVLLRTYKESVKLRGFAHVLAELGHPVDPRQASTLLEAMVDLVYTITAVDCGCGMDGTAVVLATDAFRKELTTAQSKAVLRDNTIFVQQVWRALPLFRVQADTLGLLVSLAGPCFLRTVSRTCWKLPEHMDAAGGALYLKDLQAAAIRHFRKDTRSVQVAKAVQWFTDKVQELLSPAFCFSEQ